jgi:hypothetical protein
LYQFTRKAMKQTVIIIVEYQCYHLQTKMLSNILLSELNPYGDEIIGIINVGFDVADQLLIKFFFLFFFCIRQILEKKWEHSETVH